MEENQVKKNLSDKEITDYTANLWKYKAVPSKDSVPEPLPEYRHENHTIGNRLYFCLPMVVRQMKKFLSVKFKTLEI